MGVHDMVKDIHRLTVGKCKSKTLPSQKRIVKKKFFFQDDNTKNQDKQWQEILPGNFKQLRLRQGLWKQQIYKDN